MVVQLAVSLSAGARRRRQVRNPTPAGYQTDHAVVACSVGKNIHRWGDPFKDGDTCACGALFLYTHPRGAAVFEIHAQ
jgi:hypothetical protein